MNYPIMPTILLGFFCLSGCTDGDALAHRWEDKARVSRTSDTAGQTTSNPDTVRRDQALTPWEQRVYDRFTRNIGRPPTPGEFEEAKDFFRWLRERTSHLLSKEARHQYIQQHMDELDTEWRESYKHRRHLAAQEADFTPETMTPLEQHVYNRLRKNRGLPPTPHQFQNAMAMYRWILEQTHDLTQEERDAFIKRNARELDLAWRVEREGRRMEREAERLDGELRRLEEWESLPPYSPLMMPDPLWWSPGPALAPWPQTLPSWTCTETNYGLKQTNCVPY